MVSADNPREMRRSQVRSNLSAVDSNAVPARCFDLCISRVGVSEKLGYISRWHAEDSRWHAEDPRAPNFSANSSAAPWRYPGDELRGHAPLTPPSCAGVWAYVQLVGGVTGLPCGCSLWLSRRPTFQARRLVRVLPTTLSRWRGPLEKALYIEWFVHWFTCLHVRSSAAVESARDFAYKVCVLCLHTGYLRR